MEISAKNTVSMPVMVTFILSTIVNIMLLGVLASNGFSSIILILIAALFFFIPSILICNELAEIWPDENGVFHWVRLAYGQQMALLVTWVQWAAMILVIPTVASLGASVIAYAFDVIALAQNANFVFIVSLGIIYFMSIVNAFGRRTSVRLGMVNFIGVVVVPISILVISSITWLLLGIPAENSVTYHNIFPQKHIFSLFAFLGSVILAFVGIEQPAYFINAAKSPRHYVRAVVIAGYIVVFSLLIGVVSILIFVPIAQIHAEDALLQTYFRITNLFGMSWLNYVIMFSLGFGLIANVGCLQAVCSKALQAMAKGKLLPKQLMVVNRYGAPAYNLAIQAVLVSIISLIFILMPSLNNAFVILFVILGILGAGRYIIIFSTLLKLRRKYPDKHKAYKTRIKPIITVVSGIIFVIIAILCSFIPPARIGMTVISYELIIIAGCLLTVVIPFVYFKLLKDHVGKSRS